MRLLHEFCLSRQSCSNMDGLFNANVEALANSEIGSEKCFNSITMAESEKVLYCGTCTYVLGNPIWYSGTGVCN